MSRVYVTVRKAPVPAKQSARDVFLGRVTDLVKATGWPFWYARNVLAWRERRGLSVHARGEASGPLGSAVVR